MRFFRLVILAFAGAFVLAGCDDKKIAAAPEPVKITRDATGHYCRMIVVDHKGPKGQIHITGRKAPIWFSSVRDTIAFTMLPEESKRIAAIYVNDMTSTPWDRPGPATWIDARKAVYVIGSKKRGGMGAAEAVPFKDAVAAKKFAAKFGGRIVALGKIPRQYILGEAGTAPSYGAGGHGGGSNHKGSGAAPKAGGGTMKHNKPMESGKTREGSTAKSHGKHKKP